MEQLQQENEAYAAMIARRMAKAREYVDMTQSDLAKEFDTTQNLIYRLENGLKVSLDMFLTISLYFVRRHQINYEWLFNPDPADEDSIPMLTSEQVKRQKQHDRKEAERLALLKSFLDDLSKVEKK